MGFVFSLRIPVYKEIQLPNQFSRSLSRSWLRNSWLLLSFFPFFFFSKGGGGRSESTFLVNSTPERQPCQGRCRPPGSDPLRCLSQALAHQVLPSSARPGSPTLCSVPGCLLTSPFSLASGIECPLPPPFNPSDAPHPHPDFMGRGAGPWEKGSRD